MLYLRTNQQLIAYHLNCEAKTGHGYGRFLQRNEKMRAHPEHGDQLFTASLPDLLKRRNISRDHILRLFALNYNFECVILRGPCVHSHIFSTNGLQYRWPNVLNLWPWQVAFLPFLCFRCLRYFDNCS